ncbi:hypothetical protein NC651_007738 [Populus alba x Populus x berolinensis]|nr:hypothetical protein NC651_007738 [Populus alba x Populus x berolinensis]
MIPSFYLDKQLEDDKEYGLRLFNPNPDGCNEWLDSCVIWKHGCTWRGANGRNCLGPKEECLLLPVGSQRIGKEKTSEQLCGGVIKEISACDLDPAARGSGSQVCRWLLHDSLWVELNTKEEVEGCIREVMEDRPGGSTRDPANPGLGPVRVEAKTRLGIGPGKPGRPGTWCTRPNPGETR